MDEKTKELLEAAQGIIRDFDEFGEVLQFGDDGKYGIESPIGRLRAAIQEIK